MAARIVTHPANDAYRNGYNAIYNKTQQDRQQDTHNKPTRNDQTTGEQIQAGGRVGSLKG